MSTTVEMLANQFQAQVRGNRQLIIHDAQAIHQAGPHDITFASNEATRGQLEKSAAGAVFVSKEMNSSFADDRIPSALIVVDDPRSAFMWALQQFRRQRPRRKIGISPDAYVGHGTSFGKNTNVHPNTYISENVVVGDNCDIYPGVYVGPDCQLGNDVVLHPNVVLYADVIVGNRVIIHAACVVGTDGFGYTLDNLRPDGLGRYEKIPQLGTVHIDDDVEIGACTTIDRGTIGATKIGEGTKIDNLVMVAHNCEIGRHNAFAAQVGFAGSVTTGDYVRCAGQVGVADHVHLGSGCTIDAQSGVHKDIPTKQTYFGYPAQPASDQIRCMTTFAKLPEMRTKLRNLETQVAELTARLESLISPETKP